MVVDTCSAETTVPCITSMSSSPARMWSSRALVRCGVTEAHDTTPAALIPRIRSVTRPGMMGCWYSSCIRLVAFSTGSSAISARTESASS